MKKTIASFVFALSLYAQQTTLPSLPPPPPPPTVYINSMIFPQGINLTANVGNIGVEIPMAVKLSTGVELTDLRGLPIRVNLQSPRMTGGFGFRVNPTNGWITVFSNKESGSVVLTFLAPTTALGSPGAMYHRVVVNFLDPNVLMDPQQILLVVANTQKATVGQTASQTVIVPPGDFPEGDYYLNGLDYSGGLSFVIPLGKTVRPGQAIPIQGKQVLPFDQGGWLYGSYVLTDNKRPGFPVAFGSGYVNMKYSYRNLDVRKDPNGDLIFTVNSGNMEDSYRAYVVTTDGFCVEVPVGSQKKLPQGGVQLTSFRGSIPGLPLFTAGEYTPVVVEKFSNGQVLTHSLPNGLFMEGDPLPDLPFDLFQ